MNIQRIQDLLEKEGIHHFGFCNFFDTLPLLECRAKSKLPKNAASIIVLLFPYYIGTREDANISKYAFVEDYHLVVGKLLNDICEKLQNLFPSERFVSFVDNSPIREVWAAYLAGLGVIGQNGLLIHQKLGSYCFIGEIVTTLSLPKGLPQTQGCMGCGQCQKACPGKALHENKLMQEHCLSFLTQKKGELAPGVEEKIHENQLAWGCDCCQDVCPHNRDIPITDIEAFHKSPLFHLDAALLEGDISRYAFAYRGKKVLYRNLRIISDGISNTTSITSSE